MIKMKKTLMTLATMFIAVCANAQVFVGGTAGIANTGGEGLSDKTTFKILPEVGYNINKNWAVGTVLGYEDGSFSMLGRSSSLAGDVKAFEIAPYARYTFVRTKYVNAFVDGGFGYAHMNHAHVGGSSADAWSVGLKPGISVNLNKKVSFVAHVGFAGWKSVKYDGESKDSHAWGVDLDGNNVTFGVNYNF